MPFAPRSTLRADFMNMVEPRPVTLKLDEALFTMSLFAPVLVSEIPATVVMPPLMLMPAVD